jgi:diguanylate cyclase (GGDEF)-like protein
VPPENDPFASLPVARKKKPLPKTGDIDLREAGDSDEPSDPFAKLAVDAKSQVKGGLEQIKGAFAHPLDAAKAIVKGIATSARDTFKPVVGSGQMPGSTRFGDEDAIARSRANFRVTKENTPNAITPKEQALAVANTAINLALPAAGVLSLPARAAVNAGIGAMNDSDQPLRGATAGLVLGEVLHATPKVAKTIGSPFDVSKGAIEAGVKDMAREVAADQAHGKTGMSPTRRTGDQIAMKYRKAVEPKPDAAGVSFGETPLEQLTDEQLAVRARLAEDLGVRKDAIGEIRRRVKAQPDPADAIPIEDTAPPIEPPEDATAVSFPVDEGGVKPVASANGSFDVRPGILRRINEGKDALPTPKSIPIVKREAGPSIEEPPAPRGRKAPDMFDSARTPNGSLRPFHRVSDDGLIRELTEYQAKIVDAQQRAQYNWTTDENFHSTEDGRAVVSATRIGGKGVSQQAKALQNLKDYSRIMDEIEAELDKRGHNKDTIYERQQHLSDLDAAVERDAIEHADALEESDTAFDFNDEPSAPADPFAELKTKLEEAEDRRATAEREAQHDELTGLPNKRAYQKALPSAEADPDAAVVRFDLNGFKSVNDTHGHAAGDAVLQSVPDVMAQAAADVGIPDRAFRPSGDEFAALVPKAQADAFRDRVEQLYGVKDHGKGVKTSISGGVGETDAIADQAAYQRKAIHKAEQGISSSRDPSPATAKREYLNYDKFALDQTTEARVREAVDRGRAAGTIDKGKKTFAQQRAEADRFAKEIVANPLDIDPSKLRNLSGAQIVGLHSVVGENTRIIEATSRAINSGELSPAELAEASALVDRATKSTDEALGAIVREKASTARDLGFLRQVARQSTDPDVWLVQAKKMLGDRPMPDSVMIEIRKLANEATLACGAG